MEENTDIDLKRRLRKAVSVTEKLKRKLLFESEVIVLPDMSSSRLTCDHHGMLQVSKELAKRNEGLKNELSVSHEKCRHLEELLSDIDSRISLMRDYVEQLSDCSSHKQLAELIESTYTCLSSRQRNNNALTQPTSNRNKAKVARGRAPSLFISTSSSGTSLIRKSVDEVSI
jgi:hypothetical protein